MSLDYTVCPHCGCHCEDDAYCAACGKLFDEEDVSTCKVSFLDLLRGSIRSQAEKFKVHAIEHDDELLREEPEFDPTWSFLSTNIYNRRKR